LGKQLFGTDGIRGVAGEYPLDPATVFAFGVALGQDASRQTPSPEILIGADTRESGEWIAELVAGGLESQGARVRALADFKENRVTALVATEVAARGLDIKELPHVVNYELPNVPEDYVHRIGRTARAGGTGSAVSLVAPDEIPLLKDIERLLRRAVPVMPLPEYPVNASSDGQGSGRQQQSREHQHQPRRSHGPSREQRDHRGHAHGQRGQSHGRSNRQRRTGS